MASAAAVGANAALSPDHNDIDEEESRPGEVTSAMGSKENGIEDGDDVEENDEDDIRGTARRKGPVEAAAVGDQDEQQDGEEDVGGDDLFGEDEDEAPVEEEKTVRRQLDDEELDSGDDMERRDRVEEAQPSQEQEMESQERTMMDVEMARQPGPEPSDGEMYLLKVPDFMAIDPRAYSHTSFTPPTTDHHSNKPPSTAFSAYNTAISTIRWRHSPSDPKQLQSNARILRWSDGSLTLQLASQPTVQYEIEGKALAAPQRNPVKPTPTSVAVPGGRGGRQGDGTIPGEKYEQGRDAFTYLVTPSQETSMLRLTQKITSSLTVKQSDDSSDDAIEKLQAALADASNATKVKGAANLQLIDEDPERKRQEAEKAMKQQAAARKRQAAAAEKEERGGGRGFGRSSNRYGGGGGLNASMLEDDELGGGGGRPRKAGTTPRGPRRQRRNSIYSEDEDFGRKHFASREDEYDEEDDFLAPSDEEEVVDDDEDPDDGIVEEPRERQRERTPKRPVEEAGGDADAEGEDDDDAPQARTKRRRIVDEDEDDE